MEEADEKTKTADAGWLTKSLEFVWDKVVAGDTKFNPEKGCDQLAAQVHQFRQDA